MARLLASLVCVVGLVLPAAAQGTWTGPFDPPENGVGFGSGGIDLNAGGQAVVAWAGPEFDYHTSPTQGYVMAAVRAASGTLTAPQLLEDNASLTDVSAGDGGRFGVLLDMHYPRNESLLALSDGGPFTVERVPMPENVGAQARSVELSAEGVATVLWVEPNRESNRVVLVARQRSASGEWAEPQQLGSEQDALNLNTVTDGAGTVWAFWTNDPEGGLNWGVYESHAMAGMPFTEPTPISPTYKSVRNPERLAALANARGDIAVLSTEGLYVKTPESEFTSVGSPPGLGGFFGPSPALALDSNGNTFVAWRIVDVLGSYRPASGSFGDPEVLNRVTSTQGPPAIGFDAADNLLYVDNGPDGLVASMRPADGSFGPQESISPLGTWAYAFGQFVTHQGGPSLLSWVSGAQPGSSGRDETPHLFKLSAWQPPSTQPTPVVANLEVGGAARLVGSARVTAKKRKRRAEFRFRVSEKAKVGLTLEAQLKGALAGGACYPPWTNVPGPACTTWIPFGTPLRRQGHKGANELVLTRAQTTALKKLPAIRAVLTATDSGKKTSRQRRITFRVR